MKGSVPTIRFAILETQHPSSGNPPESDSDKQVRENHTSLSVGQSRRKVPPKLYRIGEVADYSGVSRQTIHNYTIMGLIRETNRTRGGHRQYGESVFERMDRITELKAKNKSLSYMREFFARLEKSKDV